ncbi:MAG: peptidoglycan recognition protein family protein [Saprospiraceae bacterium]
MLLRFRSRGTKVKELQEILNSLGFDAGTPDGIFGRGTEAAVKAFQLSLGLDDDGVVGNMTWKALEDAESVIKYDYLTGSYISDYPLSDNEYYKEVYEKDAVFLHHTAGAARPDYVIAGWERDKSSRGGVLRVGTAFVIGRKTDGAKNFDGAVYRAFHSKYWAHHLGTRRPKYKVSNTKLNAKSIGIEICNFGPLTRAEEDGEEKFFVQLSETRKVYIPREEVCILEKPWRGHRYFQRYTEAQMASTKQLLLDLVKLFELKFENRVYDRDWFDLKFDALNGGRGLWTHCNVREDKTDCFPQPELIQMLNDLNNELYPRVETPTEDSSNR